MTIPPSHSDSVPALTIRCRSDSSSATLRSDIPSPGISVNHSKNIFVYFELLLSLTIINVFVFLSFNFNNKFV
jgi:hypothetical protein